MREVEFAVDDARPMNSAATTASAAPSVAVTTPPKMPPRMMSGSVKAQNASRKVCARAPTGSFSSTGRL